MVITAITSLPAILIGLTLKPALALKGRKRTLALLAAGGLPIVGSSFLLAACLVLVGEGFQKASVIVFLWNLPVAVLEGIITLFTVEFIARVQPEILAFSTSGNK